ncbi:MAG: type II/IV secretion system protein [Gemmatimonadota bacterium]|nr:MAG: type II/IV secretion system protein [Gemmatimonadota bacterium]
MTQTEWGERFSAGLVDLSEVTRLSDELTAEYLEEHRLLPLARENGAVLIAHAGPTDPQALAELSGLFQARVELVAVREEELLEAVRRVYGGQGTTAAEYIAGFEPDQLSISEEVLVAHDLEGLANQPPVIRLVNLLLAEAVEAGASDVHIEAEGFGLQVRYRIDGVLQEAPSPPPQLRAAIVSRLKIMAELDIAERRLPQDGRIRLRVGASELDVRVSTLPTLRGESVVLRILDAKKQRLGLEALGFADDTLEAIGRFASRPQGVLLSTGPTGSGKTTTLYAMLERISTGREKIVSVEDPVEYELPGVAQVPVQAKGGLTFARALRSILRQDPDVMLVGEMRDPETTEICVQAALTGHLVLSTLHTNDAPAALTRLLDLGVADYLVASTVDTVLAQRLVRKTCRACADAVAPHAAVRSEMRAAGYQTAKILRGTGCSECRNTGYRGRTGIYELLVVDESIREEVLRRRGASSIRRLAMEKGMRPLRADGWRQVALGVTTPEEVLRVTAV